MKVCFGGIMIKAGRRTGAVKSTCVPAWIREQADQCEWNNQFILILKAEYVNSEAAISAILGNEWLSRPRRI
jgi:hypothetical protein